jgi:hypothetical protein
MPVTSVFQRLRQACKLKANLGCVLKPCLKKKKANHVIKHSFTKKSEVVEITEAQM